MPSLKVCHPRCVRSVIQSCSVYISIYTYSHEHNDITISKKVKVIPVWLRGWVEVWLYSSMTAALEGGEWSAARPGRTLLPGKDLIPIVQESGCAPGPIGTFGKSRPHRHSIPDGPARSQSLYRPSYPAHITISSKLHVSALYVGHHQVVQRTY